MGTAFKQISNCLEKNKLGNWPRVRRTSSYTDTKYLKKIILRGYAIFSEALRRDVDFFFFFHNLLSTNEEFPRYFSKILTTWTRRF